MSKRNHGEGSKPRKRDDGRWEMKLSLGHDLNGKRIRKSVYGKTKAECLEKARKLQRAYADGKLADPNAMTVAEYLAQWLETKALEVELRTIHNYQKDVRLYLNPTIGKLSLQKLSTRQVKLMQAELAKSSGAYSANRARSLLGNAFNDAVNEGLLAYNVVTPVKSVKHEPRKVEIWTGEEVAAALAAAKSTRFYALVYTALATGMRHGELTGLEWSRLTFYPWDKLATRLEDHGEIKVDQAAVVINNRVQMGTPKSASSRRLLGMAADTREVLEGHRDLLRLEQETSATYLENNLVFPSSKGTFLNQSNTARALKKLITKADVKPITFHALRHTFASMMVAAGVDVVKLSKMLGHESPAFTLKVYAHFFERQQRNPMPSLNTLTGQDLAEPAAEPDPDAPEENDDSLVDELELPDAA